MPAPKPHNPPYLFLGLFDCRPGSASSEAGSDLELWALTAPSGPGSSCGSEPRGACAAHLPHLPVLPGVPGPGGLPHSCCLTSGASGVASRAPGPLQQPPRWPPGGGEAPAARRGRSVAVQATGSSCSWHGLGYQLRPQPLRSDILTWTCAGSQEARALPRLAALPRHARTPGPSLQPDRCTTACCTFWERPAGPGEASEGRTDENKGGEALG